VSASRRSLASTPEGRETLRYLEQDHLMIAHLLSGLENAVGRPPTPAELVRHPEGVAAVTESDFRHEERKPLGVLETLELDLSRGRGPL